MGHLVNEVHRSRGSSHVPCIFSASAKKHHCREDTAWEVLSSLLSPSHPLFLLDHGNGQSLVIWLACASGWCWPKRCGKSVCVCGEEGGRGGGWLVGRTLKYTGSAGSHLVPLSLQNTTSSSAALPSSIPLHGDITPGARHTWQKSLQQSPQDQAGSPRKGRAHCYWSERIANNVNLCMQLILCTEEKKERGGGFCQPGCCNRKRRPWPIWHHVENKRHTQPWHRQAAVCLLFIEF